MVATEKRYLTRRDVLDLLGWSRYTLYRKIATGAFPRPTLAAGERELERWPRWLIEGIAEGKIDPAAAAAEQTRKGGRR
jgi:predicted DNA-binding transcriptional regulator AlpA